MDLAIGQPQAAASLAGLENLAGCGGSTSSAQKWSTGLFPRRRTLSSSRHTKFTVTAGLPLPNNYLGVPTMQLRTTGTPETASVTFRSDSAVKRRKVTAAVEEGPETLLTLSPPGERAAVVVEEEKVEVIRKGGEMEEERSTVGGSSGDDECNKAYDSGGG